MTIETCLTCGKVWEPKDCGKVLGSADQVCGRTTGQIGGYHEGPCVPRFMTQKWCPTCASSDVTEWSAADEALNRTDDPSAETWAQLKRGLRFKT